MGTKADNIIDSNSCWNRAASGEPVFVLLGRDFSSPVAIRAWIYNRIMTGKSTDDSPEIVEAREMADVMERYAEGRGKERI